MSKKAQCELAPNSKKVAFSWTIHLFIIDETPQTSKLDFKLLTGVCMWDATGKRNIAFGGNVFFFGGDYRQTLSTVGHG